MRIRAAITPAIATSAGLAVVLTCMLAAAPEARAAPAEVTPAAAPRPASGAHARTATFAIILGVNAGPTAEIPALRFADDDAAGYLTLFRALGTRTYLLSRLDANTEGLNPQAAAEAMTPVRAELDVAVDAVAADVARARERGVPSVLYFVYAGHGRVLDGRALLTLEDGSLQSRDLAQFVRRINADTAHIIIDACYSYLLAIGRGPGGESREVQGFTSSTELAQDGRVGLLLATSTARETYEWEAVQGGVFSHEVRSGLYGAADADGDGRVSYREIAAFVDRANAGVHNEMYRPRVFARSPRTSWALVDLRGALARRIELDGSEAAHFVLESADGIRLADFHGARGEPIHLVRPGGGGTLYLRRADASAEYRIGPELAVANVATLTPETPRAADRGAAHDAFNRLFEQPFDRATVESWDPMYALAFAVPEARSTLRRAATWGSFVAPGALAVGGALCLSHAHALESAAPAGESHRDATARAASVSHYGNAATALLTLAGVGVTAGTGLLLWPGGGGDGDRGGSPAGSHAVVAQEF